VLVYSVCTFTDAEGPAQIHDLLAAHHELEHVPPEPDPAVDWGAIETGGHQVRTWPHRHDADAFFAARLRRRS
jgi:16S rRNA C967 or C1407 C5-methylase (RsmB/RsmF family)